MTAAGIFSTCPDFDPTLLEAPRNCAECLRNLRGRRCPLFRDRFLGMVGDRLGLELWQMRFVAELFRR